MNLVDQEMEEVEYPVRNEMEWLNEHMAEIFSNSHFNLTDAFKTPGKLRGKTPRTARKRNADETRMPLSEIFSSHNQMETNSNASPMNLRSIAQPIATTTTTPAASTPVTKSPAETQSRPQYPDLTKNLNSSQYNTDSGYHGMPDDATEIANSQQTSTQPLGEMSPAAAPHAHTSRASINRRTTDDSFHSAQEDIRLRGQTVEPMDVDPTLNQDADAQPPKSQLEEPENDVSAKSKTESQPTKPEPTERVPAGPGYEFTESDPKPADPEHTPAHNSTQPKHKPKNSDHKTMPSPVQEYGSKQERKPVLDEKSSPEKTRVAKDDESGDEMADAGKEDTAIDTLDDIGSPSEGSTPEPVPVRKSSLTFASLPARDPLPTKKSLGGARISRTSHVNPLNAGRPSYLGRQTGGHRLTQSVREDDTLHGEKMDVDNEDDISHTNTDDDNRASQMHSKSSTQRLHEKISMLGKLPPSRSTKSIPSVTGLSSTQVTYPELSSTKVEQKVEMPIQKSHEVPSVNSALAQNDDRVKPLDTPHTPRHFHFHRSRTADIVEKDTLKTMEARDSPANRPTTSNDAQRPRANTAMSFHERPTTPLLSTPRQYGHQKSPSVSNLASESPTPGGSPRRYEGPLSSSKFKLQSLMKSAKGLFTSSASVSANARTATSSPTPSREEHRNHVNAQTHVSGETQRSPSVQRSSPPRQGRRTRSSTEREEKRRQEEMQRQKELEDHRREEERLEKLREQEMERHRAAQEAEERQREREREMSAHVPTTIPNSKKVAQSLRQASKEPESDHDAGSKHNVAPIPNQQVRKPADRRPVKPTREPVQKSQPQPVSIRVGSALSRQIPLASAAFSSNVQDSNPAAPTPGPASTTKPSTIKKKPSNASLQTTSSTSSFKSTISSQSQRKAQLANERKKEQEEREARRREEQKRELARKRTAQQQQQEEARRRERERLGEDPRRAAQMQEIEKRRLMNARKLERPGSQQRSHELASMIQHEKVAPTPSQRGDLAPPSRPTSRLGSIQSFSRPIHTPAPNPAKPPKRHLDEETDSRPAAPKSSIIHPSGESKRRKTEDEHQNMVPIRPTMAPPIRQSNIRKEPSKPSLFGHGQHSISHQLGPSVLKAVPHPGPTQAQRPAHPLDMAKYTSSKIPFAEPSNAPVPQQHTSSSSQRVPAKASPKYPNSENINLPEIPTDSEEEDSETEIMPVPKWAQPKELEAILRQQDGMETESIFGPIAPFSLEDTFKSDKRVKKFRERTSSANWSGADGLTQEEVRRDLAERQRLRLNGGWSMHTIGQ